MDATTSYSVHGCLRLAIACLAIWCLGVGTSFAQTVTAYDDRSYSDAIDDVNSGGADIISFTPAADTTITPPATTLSNAASFINDSGYAVRLFDTTNEYSLSAASGVTLDFSGASPLSISASGAGDTSGVYGAGALNITSLGLNTTLSASSSGVSGNARAVSANNGLDIGLLSGTVSAVETGSSGYACGLYSHSGDINVTTLSGAVSASGDSSYAYGLNSDHGNIAIGTLSGAVSATSTGSTAYGMWAFGGDIAVDRLSGAVMASSVSDDAVGLYGGLGVNVERFSGSITATSSDSDALGIYAEQNLDIDQLLGSITASGNVETYGLNADTATIGTLSGSITSRSSFLYASGLYADSGLTIDTFSGSIYANNKGVFAEGISSGGQSIIGTLSGNIAVESGGLATGLISSGDLSINQLSGSIVARSYGEAVGIDAYGDTVIRELSGAIVAESSRDAAFGLYSAGTLNGGDASTPARITGTISIAGEHGGPAVMSDKEMNLYVSGALSAVDTSGLGDGFAVYSSDLDDLLTLDSARIIGMVDLGGGADILTLLGSGTATDRFLNIEDLVVGNGATPTRWEWGAGTGTTHFDAVDILSNAALQVGKGAVINSPVSVHAGGTLGGYGTVAGNVVNSGTVSPGGSIGTLTINGDYTQTAGGALFMELGTYTQDQLVVTGAANLDGTLVVVPEAGSLFRGGTSWTVLTADGGINGGFRSTSILSSSPTLTFQSTQAGGVLSVSTYRSTPYTAFALGERTMGLSQLLTSAAGDATGEMAEMLAGLDFSSEAEISYAMESLSAESYDAFSQSALEGGRALTAAQRAGLRSGGVAPGRTYIGDLNQGGGTSNALKNVGDSTGLAADEAPGSADLPELTVFLEPFGMHANQGSSSDRVGYDAMTWGLAAGFLYHPTENWTLGIAPGFFSQSLQEDGPGDGDGSVVEWSVAALIGYQTDDFYMDAMARLGFDSFRSNKDLVLPGMPRSADARWNGTNLTFALGGGYDFHAGGFTFGPVGSLAWSNLHEDSFEEKDAGMVGQKVRARNTQSLNTELGARITRTFESEYGDITPELRMVWNAEWLDGGRSITSSFIGYSGGRYSAQLADQRYHAGLLDAGLTWAVTDRFSIVARTSVELFRPDHDSLAGSLRLQYTF
ncbi:autotransporter domain-containing protein [Oceanidesulfovibrio marinus]|uniref:Autotransporter domain-containing protein n=1 Tax=Oceanidesulfovibrio marinus TaxID=370038 RepID=A0A6P1ZL85_9BACT|nr:autotransporter domain-containing protein [Oceanidesulfovibrio marinus]TVM34496.1 hypothetical protein DQK91_07940 [Oceanidesulfovibrio marinus]